MQTLNEAAENYVNSLYNRHQDNYWTEMKLKGHSNSEMSALEKAFVEGAEWQAKQQVVAIDEVELDRLATDSFIKLVTPEKYKPENEWQKTYLDVYVRGYKAALNKK